MGIFFFKYTVNIFYKLKCNNELQKTMNRGFSVTRRGDILGPISQLQLPSHRYESLKCHIMLTFCKLETHYMPGHRNYPKCYAKLIFNNAHGTVIITLRL
jgi:hypothetical protein